MVVAVVVVAGASWWHPGGDEALISLHGWDLGRSPVPLGPYSRFGWDHPGPVLFWALSVPIRLVGDAGRGAAVGAVVVNSIAAVAAVWLVARRVGPVAGAGMVGLIAVLTVTNPDGVWSVWNPYVTLLPFLAFVVACWGVADSDVDAVPVAAIAGLFCIESHIGYASVVASIAALAVVMALVAWWRRGHHLPGRLTGAVLAATAVVSAALALPVVIDQTAGTGNFGQILSYFTRSGRQTSGLDEALGQLARQLSPWGPWAGGREPSSIFGGEALPAPHLWLLVPLAAVVLAAALAWWRRDTTMLRLLSLIAVGATAGLWSVSSITPPAYPYLFVWLHVLGALLWAAVLLTVARALIPAHRHSDQHVPTGATDQSQARRSVSTQRVALLVSIVVLALIPVAAAATNVARSQPPRAAAARAADALLPAALGAVAPGDTFSISSDSPYTREAETIGAQLVEHGRQIVVDDDHALAWGTQRLGDINDPALVQLRLIVGNGPDPLVAPDGWQLLAQWDPATIDPSTDPGNPLGLITRTRA